MLILLLTTVLAYRLIPSDVVRERDENFARLWNEGNYEKIVKSMFHKNALVIPPMPTRFIKQPDILNYFLLNHEYWNDNMTMIPEVVGLELEYGVFAIHEIGRWSGVYNRYYQRWVKEDRQWWITFLAIAIGEPDPEASNPPFKVPLSITAADPPSKYIAKLEKRFDFFYNRQDFESVTDLFHSSALLIPRSADRFLTKAKLPEYWQMAYNLAGLKHANTRPIIVLKESPVVIHEMGGIQVNNETHILPYYVRWLKNGTSWNMKFYLSVFPIPHAHPPEIKLG